jgi:hypothetical protein
MLSLISLPADFLSSTTAYIGEIFGDLWILVALAIGLPLAFWFIGKVIALVRGGFRTRTPRA